MDLSGSHYVGETLNGRMHGKGKYIFANGNYYEGEFKDGVFDGEGTLYFKDKGSFKATWQDGLAIDVGLCRLKVTTKGEYTFSDGLKYKENEWNYCTGFDRRFYTEILNHVQAAGRSQLTNSLKRPVIPPGSYDCGNGYYDPKDGHVHEYTTGYAVRTPNQEEVAWILQNCRIGQDDGY